MITPGFSLTAVQRVLPKLALDFTTATLDARIVLTRALNTATRINSLGFVEVVNADLPRFDYDSLTTVCKGLLIEESRINTNQYSEDLSNGYWSKIASSVTLSSVTNPANGANAYKLIADSTTGVHYLDTGNFNTTSGTAYTKSVFVKAAEYSRIQLHFPPVAFTAAQLVTFDLVAKTATVVAGTPTATITELKNGWFRCTMTATATANTTASTNQIRLVDNSGNISFAGNSVNGLYIWGVQAEAGAFPTSYIPTTSANVTRNADVATMTGTNFSNWFNATQGTFRVDASTPAIGTRPLISADDNTSGNSIVVSTVGTAPKLVVTQSSAEQANVAAGTVSANTAMFAYVSYAANYFGIARPSARQVDTSGTVPTVDRLRIGADQANNYANGVIQAIQFWP